MRFAPHQEIFWHNVSLFDLEERFKSQPGKIDLFFVIWSFSVTKSIKSKNLIIFSVRKWHCFLINSCDTKIINVKFCMLRGDVNFFELVSSYTRINWKNETKSVTWYSSSLLRLKQISLTDVGPMTISVFNKTEKPFSLQDDEKCDKTDKSYQCKNH